MSGVIGVVDVVSEMGAQSATVADGILNVLYFMALIAVNLAVMNMLPIPALDGGRVFFILLNGLIWLFFGKRIAAMPQSVMGSPQVRDRMIKRFCVICFLLSWLG